MIDTRATEIIGLYKSGQSTRQIGKAVGLSHAQVSRIIKRHGVLPVDRYKTVLGCSAEQWLNLKEMGNRIVEYGGNWGQTPIGAYIQQRNNAKKRGVAWKLTLWDWWQVWVASDKFDRRGRGRGNYVMCRSGDDGAYEIGNVYIDTKEHNSSIQPNNPRRKNDHGRFISRSEMGAAL